MTNTRLRRVLTRMRAVVSIVVTMCLVGGCHLSVQASQSQTTPGTRGPADPSVILEFDLPPDFHSRSTSGTFVVRAVQVGLFWPNGQLARTVEIPRDEIRVTGQTGEVSIPALPLPEGANRVNARLRILSSGTPGAWSDGVGLTLPVIERRRREVPPPATVLGVAPQEVARRQALKEALDPLLGSDLSLSVALGSFSRVQDLATAIVVARTQNLSFSTLCQVLRESPGTSLTEALAKLKPSVDAAQAVRAAQKEARPLLVRTPGARP